MSQCSPKGAMQIRHTTVEISVKCKSNELKDYNLNLEEKHGRMFRALRIKLLLK